MKRLTIDGKEYTIEYSIEATLYNECTEKMMDMFVSAGIAQAKAEDETSNTEDKVKVMADAFVDNVKDIPQRALVMLYAGLLEHHSAEVRSKEDAKKLLVSYIKENPGKSLYDVVQELVEVMGNDHFFEMIGVDKLVENANKTLENEKKKLKTPQDHKKKSGDK